MRKLWEILSRASRALKKQLENWYSPREIRAIVLFLGLGVAVLCYRGGRVMYELYLPAHLPKARAAEITRTDSLFKVLSAKAAAEDSMIFALPEDSLAPKSMRTAPPKGSTLPPAGIALNLTTKEQLMQLPGVGPSTAERILAYRSKRGKFRSVDELMNVKGIGESRFARMKPYLRLD
jgi:comEA protein